MPSIIHALSCGTQEMLDIFADAALLRAALRFEAALAKASAAEGVIPAGHAEIIAAACANWAPDTEQMARDAAFAGTLAIPLVRSLRARAGEAGPSVHLGATSQDVADTAAMLQARSALAVLNRDVRALAKALNGHAQREAATAMAARTLLQPALPTTFALKAAIWLDGVQRAAARLRHEAASAIVLQFGGAAGTRAGLQGRGAAIAHRIAAELDLPDPVLPWHARREALAGLGTALAILTGAIAKIARDISLLAQPEIGEAQEPSVPGRGGSSAMAHKRNPTGCQMALTAAARAPGLAGTLIAGLPAEHERGIGGWQAEAPILAELFLLAHGAVSAMLPVVQGLELNRDAMHANLARAGIGQDTGEAEAMVKAALLAWPEGDD